MASKKAESSSTSNATDASSKSRKTTSRVAKTVVAADLVSADAEEEEGTTPTPEPASSAVADDAASASPSTLLGTLLSSVGANVPSQLQSTESDETSLSVSLPVTLEFQEGVEGTLDGTAFEFRMFGEGCLDCSVLVPSFVRQKPEPLPKCHFKFGNKYCPAAYHRIVFVGERLTLVNNIRKAQASGDANRLLHLLAKLEELSVETKVGVLRDLNFIS